MALALATVLAFAVGVSLGLLGGGGSVLSVPLLVFVAGWSAHRATTGSLVIVGLTSLIGLVPHARAGRVRWRTGTVFGLAGMVGAYTGGRLAGLVPGTVLLVTFALMMLAAGGGMIRGQRGDRAGREELHVPAALGLGVAVGAATGFVGAGGGFVIVPALVLVAGLAMPAAVGTSLLVICMQSAAGLAGHLAGVRLPWAALLGITASAIAGSLVGGRFTARIPAPALRRGFGFLVLAVAGLVLVEQLGRHGTGAAGPWSAGVLAALGLAGIGLVAARRTARAVPQLRPVRPTAPSRQDQP